MKTAIVPAQITTIEDKIAGNLSMSQMALLLSPIFISGLIIIVLPPFEHFSLLKIVLSVVIASVCVISAIRIDGKILLTWTAVLLRYNVRPQFYVYDKNNNYHRESLILLPADEMVAMDTPVENRERINVSLPLRDKVAMELMLGDPSASVVFTPGKKGGVHVRIAEIKG